MIPDRSLAKKAQDLHSKGLSCFAISKILNVSKTTIGRWVREIITDERRKEARRLGNKKRSETFAKKRAERQKTKKIEKSPKEKESAKSLPLSESEQIADFIAKNGITVITPEMIGTRLSRYLLTGEPLFKQKGVNQRWTRNQKTQLSQKKIFPVSDTLSNSMKALTKNSS